VLNRFLRILKSSILRWLEESEIMTTKTPSEDSFIPDFTTVVFSAPVAYAEIYKKGFHEGLAIGWLGKHVTNEGQLDTESIKIINNYKTHHAVDCGELGFHTCEICNAHKGRGEFVIELGSYTYYLPQMIIHYISAHNYLPPTKFINDIKNIGMTQVTKTQVQHEKIGNS
jgi:hypothetical protein